MRRTATVNGVAVVIVALGIGVVGCGSGSTPSSNKTSSTASTATTAAPTTTAKPQSKVAPRTTVPGPNPTIASYLQQNGITQTPVHRGDPGAPTINLPNPRRLGRRRTRHPANGLLGRHRQRPGGC